MSKELIVSSTSLETKLAILENNQVAEILVERTQNRGILGNVYKGRVTKVLPGMQAAFVDIGMERHAFLYVDDVLEGLDSFAEMFGDGESDFDADPSPDFQEDSEDPKAPVATVSYGNDDDSVDYILPLILDLAVAPAKGSFRARQDSGPAGILAPGLALSVVGNGYPQERESPSSDVAPRATGRPKETPRRTRGRRTSNINRPSIGDLLKVGQEILVQVSKEPIGKKGARITSHIALPGRNVVYMPTVNHVGISRKITDSTERNRLRQIALKVRGQNSQGFIVRTVGEGQSESELAADMQYLIRLWEKVLGKSEHAGAPRLVHFEPTLVERVVRDRFNSEFSSVHVDDQEEFSRIVEIVTAFNPELVSRVKLYSKSKPIFDQFGVTQEIEKALKHKVWLKNGGHIVINQTEALVAIDVNTGRFVGSSNSLEETITKTNLDAVREVVRQIRLRDLGGIIIIDFIDMDEPKNRRKVMEALQRELANDKSPSKILKFNEFGLVAITRKRSKQSLEKVLCQPCIFCSGTGVTKSARTMAYSIHQEVRRMQRSFGKGSELTIRCHPEVAKVLKDTEKEVIAEIAEVTGKKVSVRQDPLMHIEQFDLVES